MRLSFAIAARKEFPLGFTRTGVERRLGLPGAAAVIRYARLRGELERLSRGRYRSRVPTEITDRTLNNLERVRERLLSLDRSFPGALDGAAAVWAWTRGGYAAGMTAWRTVVLLAVPRSAITEARRRLTAMGVDVRREYPAANELGVFAVLKPVPTVERTFIAGVPVISRRVLEREIDANLAAFGPARKYLEEAEAATEVLR